MILRGIHVAGLGARLVPSSTAKLEKCVASFRTTEPLTLSDGLLFAAFFGTPDDSARLGESCFAIKMQEPQNTVVSVFADIDYQ